MVRPLDFGTDVRLGSAPVHAGKEPSTECVECGLSLPSGTLDVAGKLYCDACWLVWGIDLSPVEARPKDGQSAPRSAEDACGLEGRCAECGQPLPPGTQVSPDGSKYCDTCWDPRQQAQRIRPRRVGRHLLGKPAREEDGLLPDLRQTFGYVAGLDAHPPFAKFDVRDEVCLRVGGFRHGQIVRDVAAGDRELAVVGVHRIDGVPRLWFQPQDFDRPAAGAFPGASATFLQSRLLPVFGVDGSLQRAWLHEVEFRDTDEAEDSDGEVVLLCRSCRLPVGDFAYADDDKGDGTLHAECRAQMMLDKVRGDEEARLCRDRDLKKNQRAEYGLGWKVEQIPRNLSAMRILGVEPVARGMCCLVYNKESLSVSLGETFEPSSHVNLEYLSLALRVRFLDGTEPIFSLDPVSPSGFKATRSRIDPVMQVKRFEPAWLAGTSAGEVLFQADYHLKELSMGEFEQPVVGMKSSFTFGADQEDEWNARVWFVVNNAEVHLLNGSVLVPRVTMGVEAREQEAGPNGLEDKLVTRRDHPLHRYAGAFTHNFDLIAERKSVIYHLRMLAKMSLLAKFLMDSDTFLDEPWLRAVGDTSACCCLEVPQLWNERRSSRIQVEDGEIVGAAGGIETGKQGVYGGVDFGLNRYMRVALVPIKSPAPLLSPPGVTLTPHPRLAPPEQPPTTVLSPEKVAAVLPQQRARAQQQAVSAFQGGKGAVAAAWAPVGRIQHLGPLATPVQPPPPLRGISATQALRQVRGTEASIRGVDLCMDKFDLSEPVHEMSEGPSSSRVGSWAGRSAGGFWTAVDRSSSEVPVVSEDDRRLLRDVFNPHLSDRRDEGDLFVPPDTGAASVQALCHRMEEERRVRAERRRHFLSEAFVMCNPGPLFPASWVPSFEIAHGTSTGSSRQLRTYRGKEPVVLHRVKSSTPVFDKASEDGMRFRIYRHGGLEVRTIQEHNGAELIGGVFSTRGRSAHDAAREGEGDQGIRDCDAITKATEYVMNPDEDTSTAELHYRSYVVLETEHGDAIGTEQLSDGSLTWEENPEWLEDHSTHAKVIRVVECSESCIAVEDMKMSHKDSSYAGATSASQTMRKHYAQSIFNRTSEARLSDSGFWQRSKGKWELKAGPGQGGRCGSRDSVRHDSWDGAWRDDYWCGSTWRSGKAGARQGLSKVNSMLSSLTHA